MQCLKSSTNQLFIAHVIREDINEKKRFLLVIRAMPERKRFFSLMSSLSMESLVNNKLSASHEFLFTVFALECFNSNSVSFLMTSKVFLRFERSSTFWTGILLSNIMDVLVVLEVLLSFKCFLTNCTCKRRLIGVHYLVLIQIGRRSLDSA